jgi:predicted Zn-dependent peptidase
VLAELLGGTMGAEAQARVREGMTAAYAVGARVTSHPEASAMSIGGAFARERAVDGVRELLEAIRGLRDHGPSEDALERAKQSVIGKWRTIVRTDDGLSTTLAQAWVDRIPFEEALGYPAKAAAVDADAVRRVARYYLAPDALHVALQGDTDFIGSARALDLGAPVRVDGYGRAIDAYGRRL